MNSPRQDPTRERILDAADRLIEQSPAEFTVERVASEAEVSRATVYRRFGRAEELLAALSTERGVERAVDRVDVRLRLLDSARVEFARHGVGATTVAGVADRAGVSVTTLYNHFDDKEAVLTALMAEFGPISVLAGIEVDEGTPDSQLRTFVRGALALSQEHAEMFRLLMAPDPVTRRAFDRVRKGADGLEARLVPILEKVGLSGNVSPERAVIALMGMIFSNGIFIPMMTGTPVRDVDGVADQIVHIFLHGVRSGERNTASPKP